MGDTGLYTIGEVAAILGVSPHTIRAWERRHGILQPQRTDARQRRYRAEDIDLLRDVKRAVELKGLSLKLAFQTVSGSQVIESPVPRRDPKQPAPATGPAQDEVWRGVADVLPQLVFLIDSTGKIVESNIAAAKTIGVVLQRLRGRLFADLVDPFDRAKAVLLYRPRPRTLAGWELNLVTQAGPRLYSFQSWPVRRDGGALQALIGSEMYGASAPRPHDEYDMLASGRPSLDLDSDRDPTAANAFHALVDQMPFGVAVATVGAEPRVVYANPRLSKAMGVAPRVFTGRPVHELMPGEGVLRALRKAVVTRSTQTLKKVAVGAGIDPGGSPRFFKVRFQPLFSSSDRVASVMVTVEDATIEATHRQELERLVADHRFEEAKTARQLGDVGLRYLVTLVPKLEFVLAVAASTDSGARVTVITSPAARRMARVEPAAAELMRRGLRQTLATGTSSQVVNGKRGHAHTLTAMPFSPKQMLGALVWARPPRNPLPAEQRKVVDAIVARLAVATELLHVRADSARKAARFKAAVTAASVLGDSGGPTGLGRRFLRRLTEIVDADGVAIGKVDGPDFVVEAAYARGGAHAKAGDRFPLTGQFVSIAVRTGAATGTTRFGSPELSAPIRKALAPMRHGLSIPIVFMGQVIHVIALLRRADRPFGQDDANLVQALSGTVLLAMSMARSGLRSARSRAPRVGTFTGMLAFGPFGPAHVLAIARHRVDLAAALWAVLAGFACAAPFLRLVARLARSRAAALLFAGVGTAVAATALDLSSLDPSGPALAWSPGVAALVLSVATATPLRRLPP